MNTIIVVRRQLLSIIFILLVYNVFSQSKIENDLSEFFNNIRNDENEYIILNNYEEILENSSGQLLDALLKYNIDINRKVRYVSLMLQMKIAKSESNISISTKIVNRLVNACSDPEIYVRQQAKEWLKSFSSTCYNESSKEIILQLFNENSLDKDIILILGIAQMENVKEKLINIINDTILNTNWETNEYWYSTYKWHSHLALARMGSEEDIKLCINKVENESDEILRVIVLLNDIAYIRQQESINVLHKYLDSNEMLPPVDNNYSGMCYCQYAMDLLAQFVKDFPYKSRGVGYTPEQIINGRLFMDSNSNFEIIK